MLEESDLPEDFKIVAEFCGLDIAKPLLTELEGMRIYIPQIKTLKKLNIKYIKKFMNSKTIRQLARDLNMSETSVKSYLNEIKK